MCEGRGWEGECSWCQQALAESTWQRGESVRCGCAVGRERARRRVRLGPECEKREAEAGKLAIAADIGQRRACATASRCLLRSRCARPAAVCV